jgi:membrane-bound metal-dependent hydrolase YbcI (DUF457 family)
MYAVGHLALGYLTGKASAKLQAVKANVPTILVLSILPDADILLQPFIPGIHRGPTHSIIVLSLIFLPIFLIHRKKAVPYFVAIVSHPLIGDFLVGRTKLLWPLQTSFGIGIPITSSTNVVLEWSLFLLSIILMLKTTDMHTFLEPHLSNLLLCIPAFTVLLPTIASFPLGVPVWLEPPHLIYMLIFVVAIILALPKLFKNASLQKLFVHGMKFEPQRRLRLLHSSTGQPHAYRVHDRPSWNEAHAVQQFTLRHA